MIHASDSKTVLLRPGSISKRLSWTWSWSTELPRESRRLCSCLVRCQRKSKQRSLQSQILNNSPVPLSTIIHQSIHHVPCYKIVQQRHNVGASSHFHLKFENLLTNFPKKLALGVGRTTQHLISLGGKPAGILHSAPAGTDKKQCSTQLNASSAITQNRKTVPLVTSVEPLAPCRDLTRAFQRTQYLILFCFAIVRRHSGGTRPEPLRH